MRWLWPLAFLTGAMPKSCCTSWALAKRSRWLPKATSKRGASTGPAPGKLLKIAASGWAVKAFWISSSRVEREKHGGQGLHLETGGQDQRRVGGQGPGAGQGLEARLHFFGAAAVVRVK